MGAGAGADFADESLIPATLGAIRAQMAPDIAAALRWIKKAARTVDERIWMLTTIVGEGGEPRGVQLKVTEGAGDRQ